MLTIAGVTFAALMSATCATLIFLEYRRTEDLINPLSLFLALAIIDIFLPGGMFLVFGPPDLPQWHTIPTPDTVVFAMIIYAGFLALLTWGYSAGSRSQSFETANASEPMESSRIAVLWAYVILGVAGFLYFLGVQNEISKWGSLQAFVSSRLELRWIPEARLDQSVTEMLVRQASTAAMPIMFMVVGVLFCFRHEYRRSVLWGVVLPLAAWPCSLLTFCRGTQVALFVSLLTVESYSLRNRQLSSFLPRERSSRGGLRTRLDKMIVALSVVGAIMFFTYGTARTYFERDHVIAGSTSWDEAAQIELQGVLSGHGLLGLAAIIEYYPQRHEYWRGKTFVDMLLLPVPRYFYQSKPQWYGIDDITRGMGWPETTQSAVTMPGEMYANFGPAGLLIGVGYGFIFGLFYRYGNRRRFHFIYAFSVLPSVFTVHWMSFTGFMNSLIAAPLMFAALSLIVRRNMSYSVYDADYALDTDLAIGIGSYPEPTALRGG